MQTTPRRSAMQKQYFSSSAQFRRNENGWTKLSKVTVFRDVTMSCRRFGAICYLYLQDIRNHHEFLKSHKHQFQDCNKALGSTVILFFGVNEFPYFPHFPQGHNFVWHTIWINITRRYRWWRGKRRQIHTNLPSPNPFSVLVTLKHTCVYTHSQRNAQYALRNKLLNKAK